MKFIKIVLSLFILLSLSGCFKKQVSKPAKKPSDQNNKQEAKTKELPSFIEPLAEAIKSDGSMQCTWKQDKNNFGTTYIKGENYRNENTIEGKLNYLIYKNNCTYSWQENETEGMEFCFKEEGISQMAEVDELEKTEQEKLKLETQKWAQEFNYKCLAAEVADDLFVPPADVDFINPKNKN